MPWDKKQNRQKGFRIFGKVVPKSAIRRCGVLSFFAGNWFNAGKIKNPWGSKNPEKIFF